MSIKPEQMSENNYAVNGDSILTIVSYPKIVGYWIPVKGTKIGTSKMPSKFHQLMMGWAFGWEFEEIEKGK